MNDLTNMLIDQLMIDSPYILMVRLVVFYTCIDVIASLAVLGAQLAKNVSR